MPENRPLIRRRPGASLLCKQTKKARRRKHTPSKRLDVEEICHLGKSGALHTGLAAHDHLLLAAEESGHGVHLLLPTVSISGISTRMELLDSTYRVLHDGVRAEKALDAFSAEDTRNTRPVLAEGVLDDPREDVVEEVVREAVMVLACR